MCVCALLLQPSLEPNELRSIIVLFPTGIGFASGSCEHGCVRGAASVFVQSVPRLPFQRDIMGSSTYCLIGF